MQFEAAANMLTCFCYSKIKVVDYCYFKQFFCTKSVEIKLADVLLRERKI